MFQSPSESSVCPPSFRSNRRVTSPETGADHHGISFSDAALSTTSLEEHGPPPQLHRWSLNVEASENGSFVHDRTFNDHAADQHSEGGSLNKAHSLASHLKEKAMNEETTSHDMKSTTPLGLTIPSLLPSKLLGGRKKKEKRKEEGSVTSFDKEELKQLSEEFSAIDKSGNIGLNEFVNCLGRLNDSDNQSDADLVLGKILFRAFDKDNSGTIDYREFLATMAILSRGSVEQKIEFAFSMIDLDHDGKLSREELQKVITALYKVLTSLGLGSKTMQDPIVYANKLFDEMDEEKCGYLTLEAYKKGALKNSNLLKGLGVLESSESVIDQDALTTRENGMPILTENDLKNTSDKPMKHQGKIIGFGSRKWNLCLNMMIGIRLSSDCIGSIDERDVRMEDFSVRLMFDLPKESSRNLLLSNSDTTRPHSPRGSSLPYDSEEVAATFVDYAPFVFKHIRKMTGITEASYMLSLGPEQLLGNLLLGSISTLSEHLSDGKSGSFFFYSNDRKFMVKTISKAEVACLKRILPMYYKYLSQNPDSLIVRILGHHEMIINSERINFIVMGNIFSSSRPVIELYDLKGSTQGRKNPEGFCKKDLDLLEKKRTFTIGLENKLNYMKIIEKDTQFLASCNLLDYSLLVGVCKAARSNNTTSSSSGAATISNFVSVDSQQEIASPTTILTSTPNTSRKTSGFGARLMRNNKCVCAIPSSQLAKNLEEESELYYIGIIDILTEWTFKKESEHHLKSITSKSDTISAIHPKPYSERFFKFMYQAFE
ncbi:hypothetical protein C9374_013612 [Naegleria lovaniensis]|uniref:Phosphatidylinositol-4-phosphate 5-kinase n=1 Tax=Naegleria lovaniensis TaxID=51637 RepID=A0AA88KDW4_NAELO|nr:uncharacterized protein C9374_013612 [Naegleria lovaniensis]KAG2372711.1 hypothetical protein C9374_013612 [Naegleria lovaniensis]